LQYAIILVQIRESVSEGITHNNMAAQTNLKLYSLHDNYSKHKSWLSGSVGKVIAKLPQISLRIIFAPKSESFTVLEYIYAAGLLLVSVTYFYTANRETRGNCYLCNRNKCQKGGLKHNEDLRSGLRYPFR